MKINFADDENFVWFLKESKKYLELLYREEKEILN